MKKIKRLIVNDYQVLTQNELNCFVGGDRTLVSHSNTCTCTGIGDYHMEVWTYTVPADYVDMWLGGAEVLVGASAAIGSSGMGAVAGYIGIASGIKNICDSLEHFEYEYIKHTCSAFNSATQKATAHN